MGYMKITGSIVGVMHSLSFLSYSRILIDAVIHFSTIRNTSLLSLRLSLHSHQEVFSRLLNRMYKHLIAVWPLSFKFFLLIVFRKRLFLHLVVEQNGFCCVVGLCTDRVRAFDFSALDTADAIVVVVYCCLKYCLHSLVMISYRLMVYFGWRRSTIMQNALHLSISIPLQLQHIWFRIQTDFKFLSRGRLRKS